MGNRGIIAKALHCPLCIQPGAQRQAFATKDHDLPGLHVAPGLEVEHAAPSMGPASRLSLWAVSLFSRLKFIFVAAPLSGVWQLLIV